MKTWHWQSPLHLYKNLLTASDASLMVVSTAHFLHSRLLRLDSTLSSQFPCRFFPSLSLSGNVRTFSIVNTVPVLSDVALCSFFILSSIAFCSFNFPLDMFVCNDGLFCWNASPKPEIELHNIDRNRGRHFWGVMFASSDFFNAAFTGSVTYL